MQKRIFYSVFFVSMCLLVLANVFFIINAESFFKKQMLSDMKKQINTFLSVNLSVQNFDKNLSTAKDFSTQNRLTIIDEKGNVLFDNFAHHLENHFDRAEIQETLAKGESFKLRYSHTLKQDLMYYAKAYKDSNQSYIIRISTPTNSLTKLVLNLIWLFVGEIVILLFVCFVVARVLTRWIVSPIKNINLDELDKKNSYTELHAFIKKIKSQNKIIKKSSKKLLQKQQEGILLAQNIKDGFMLLNAKGMILLANNNIEQYLRINGAISVMELENSAFRELALQTLDAFKAQQSNANQTMQLTLNEYECELIFSPIFVETKFKGLMILIQNISEEKLAQNLRKEFSANVTHELKTPLTSILASSEMIKNNLVQNADMPQFIDKIYNESKRLLQMIDEILRLSFFDENKQDLLQKQNIHLKALILNVITRLKAVAEARGISFRYELEDVKIFGVYELMENLIYNLCDNAIKYNKQNGFVDITLIGTDDNITLSVKDSGIGIKKEYRDRIFERFFCVDKSRSKQLGGTGLGLSIVKHACAYHKAQITLKSEFGVGSEFCVIFDKESSQNPEQKG